MYSVYIIDDEPWAVKLIEKGFPWQQYAFYVQGKSRTVSQAMQDILSLQPDVVFTDIRIAGDNGIDLIRALRAQGLDTVFIIVTGYDDFDVAQAAIKLDVFDLLLKPIDLDEAEGLLKRLQAFLMQRNRQSRPVMELLEGISIAQCINRFSGCESADSVRAVYIQNLHEDKTADLPVRPLLSLVPQEGQLLYLFKQQPGFETEFLAQLEALYPSSGIGVSEAVSSSDPVLVSVSHAQMMAAQSFLTGVVGVSIYNRSHYQSVAQLAQALLKGEPCTADALYKRWLRESWNLEDLAHLVRFLSQSSPVNPISNYQDLLHSYENAQALAQQLLADLAILAPTSALVSRSDIYRKLLQLAQERFADNISLSQLAAELNLSVSYLSEIFTQNQGISFSKYLKHLRNVRACELLKGTQIPIHEVAELAGFNDYFYFCKQFKSEFGLTPKQYRIQNR